MILSTHISGIANTAAFLSGIITNLNIKESNRTKLSASVSTFLWMIFYWVIYFETKIDIGL